MTKTAPTSSAPSRLRYQHRWRFASRLSNRRKELAKKKRSLKPRQRNRYEQEYFTMKSAAAALDRNSSLNTGAEQREWDRLEIDSFTARVIREEVESVLRERRACASRTSVLTMADALAGSARVMEAYVQGEASRGQRRAPEGWLASTASFISSRFQSKLPPKYRFMQAMDRLKMSDTASVTYVNSWLEARSHLSIILSFPSDNIVEEESSSMAVAEESSSSDETMLSSWIKKIRLATRQHVVEKEAARKKDQSTSSTSVREKLLEIAHYPLSHTYHDPLQDEYKKRQDRLKHQFVKETEERMRLAEAEAEARKRAAALMRPLSQEERAMIRKEWDNHGRGDEIIRVMDTDSVQRESFQRLLPGQWLNDEVIHYFLVMLSKRDEALCQSGARSSRSHFFKSYFMTKLLNIGALKNEGMYDYSNVKRWSKKVPGKDIFKLDKIIFPINQGGMHWVCAVAFIQQRKIQFFDSMGDSGMEYLKHILHYLKDEHESKKGTPLPDEESWELVPCLPDVPRQRNGYDCGVFTCMFADFISKDSPLVFNQSHVTQCRERIALSILKGSALE